MKSTFKPIRFYNKLLVTVLASRVNFFLMKDKFRAANRNNPTSRSAIFDYTQLIVLLRLAWVSQSTDYLISLPLWLPSIPIAHRKLII